MLIFCRFMCCPPDPPTPLQFRAYIYHLARALALVFFLLFFTFCRLLSVFLRVVWLSFDTEDSLPML